MSKARIQVYADAETKRRIELAAAKRDTAVTQYCLDAIVQQLADDELLEANAVVIHVRPASDEDLLDEMRLLKDEILARRGGELIPTDILEQVRAERDDELVDLH